jgi:hypothetical protein
MATTRRRLARAYALALEGAGGPASATLYESAYVGSGRLYQAPAGEMQALLIEANLAPTAGFGEPPDHISVELALAAHALQSRGGRAGRMARRLADWTLRFAQRRAGRQIRILGGRRRDRRRSRKARARRERQLSRRRRWRSIDAEWESLPESNTDERDLVYPTRSARRFPTTAATKG